MKLRPESVGLKLRGKIAEIERPLPLIGHIAFGVIDRGYNIVQVRATSLCVLSCRFCSVGAGPSSQRRLEFMLRDPEWLVAWLRRVHKHKGKFHVLFDAVGEPLTHPALPDFVEEVSKSGVALSTIIETRLHPADESLLEKLVEAGASQFNVSIDSLDPSKARWLAGSESYDVEKVAKLVEFLHFELGVKVHLTPLWLPGVNDSDIEQIIEWALRLGLGRGIPPVGVQKYVAHKRGRKMSEAREWSWDRFYRELEKLEEKFGVRLALRPEDYGLNPAPRVPLPYRRGDTVKLVVVSEGWLPGEMLAVTLSLDRVFTLLCKRESFEVGDEVVARVIEDEDGVMIARPV
ncbi:MAG: radical SAM protein [Fervidicoccaceae archaeon]